MPLNKSIQLPLRVFISKASPSRRRFVIPEMCMAHSGTGRPRGQKKHAIEARGLRTGTRLGTGLKGKSRKDLWHWGGHSRGSRQLEPNKPRNSKKRHSRLAVTDCAAG